jgi:hypothetical protein
LELLLASDRNSFASAQLFVSNLDFGAEPVPELIPFHHQPKRLADDLAGIVIPA